MKRREDVSGEGYAPTRIYGGGHVLGEVALWGRVIEHEKGYRATCAYPYRLHMDAPVPMPGFPRSAVKERLARALSAAYGCEVVT